MILWTNGQLYILAGISNAAFSTPGILTNDGSGKFYSTFPLPKGSSDLGYATNETTRQVLNATNSPAMVYGATTAIGAQFATNDSTGTAILTRFQQGTNEVTRQVLNATNSPAVVFEASRAIGDANGLPITCGADFFTVVLLFHPGTRCLHGPSLA